MQSEIIELINRNFQQLKVQQKSEYYIKIEIGKFHSSNIFENIGYKTDEILDKYELVKSREYYLYQYQNQIYQRERSFKSYSFTDDLIDIQNYKAGLFNFDYRITLHNKTHIQLFSQHMNYHNIMFVSEKVIKITDECSIYILEYNMNNKKLKKIQQVYFKIKAPLSQQSIDTLIKEIEQMESVFIKHKSDKKHMFHSLDLVLESEQPLQVSDQDK
jgi:hypothetical protein